MEGRRDLGLGPVPGVVFDVSDVGAETSPMSKASASACWEARGWSFLDAMEDLPPQPSSIEACSEPADQLVACNEGEHSLLSALHSAFQLHRPLSLSPDAIWLLILQGFTAHVSANAERLRPLFVTHAGKLDIVWRDDSLRMGNPDNDWSGVVDGLCTTMAEHLMDDTGDMLLPRFSTTTAVHRTAARVAMLDAMQSYFAYRVDTLCGIPRIHLEGSVGDWRMLAERAARLAPFDLEWWVRPLVPILDEFVAAARGQANPRFWRSIYKYDSGSGGAWVTGWINAFFPYVRVGGGRGGATDRNPCLVRPGEEGLAAPGVDGFVLGVGSFPDGISRAPFIWRYLGRELKMNLLAGFFAVHQDAETGAVGPAIGWAVDHRERREEIRARRQREIAALHAERTEQAHARARRWIWKAMCPVCGEWKYSYLDDPPNRHCGQPLVNVEYRVGDDA